MQNQTSPINVNIAQEIWAQLLRASVDKHHEWRSVVLVTNGLDEWPDARMVILRAVNIDTKTLTFYTDSRSQKINQLLLNSNAVLVFWSKKLNWQLRIKVTIDIKTEGEQVKNMWQNVKQSPSAGDYLSAKAPGEMLDNAHEKAETSLQNPENQSHFAILIAQVQSIDWLALNRAGHQRATIDKNGVCYTVP
jgi:pyridoxamine 5'-phosphate oxidase